MMDNTPAQKCRKSHKNRHIRPPFSPFYMRKCLTNSGRYILSQGAEENSNAICSLSYLRTQVGLVPLHVPDSVQVRFLLPVRL